jgi:ribosomal protein S18 acetylase RimI-like enzyme
MVQLQPVTPQNVMLFKEARLRALLDTPSAFGSTYARESQFTDEFWVTREEQRDPQQSILYMAVDAQAVFGIAGCFIDSNDKTHANLISMWTAPESRQQGIGRILVEEIAAWARQRKANTLQLMVTSSNESALLFYQRLGFELTGYTEPYPNDPALTEYQMARPLL